MGGHVIVWVEKYVETWVGSHKEVRENINMSGRISDINQREMSYI